MTAFEDLLLDDEAPPELIDLTGPPPPPPPLLESVCREFDGKPLLYQGRSHGLVGVSESGKTMIGYRWGIQHALAGGRTVIADFEMGPVWAHARAHDLGAGDLKSGLWLADTVDPRELLNLLRVDDLLLLDSMDAAYGMMGLNPNHTEDAAKFSAWFLRPARDIGVTSVLVDHVTTTNADKRGAAGNFRKLADTDVSYKLTASTPVSRVVEGRGRLYVEKDRGGKLDFSLLGGTAIGRAERLMADVTMTPISSSAVDVRVWPPVIAEPLERYGGFTEEQLATWANRIIEVLETLDGELLGMGELRDRTASLNGSRFTNAKAWGIDNGRFEVVVESGKKCLKLRMT